MLACFEITQPLVQILSTSRIGLEKYLAAISDGETTFNRCSFSFGNGSPMQVTRFSIIRIEKYDIIQRLSKSKPTVRNLNILKWNIVYHGKCTRVNYDLVLITVLNINKMIYCLLYNQVTELGESFTHQTSLLFFAAVRNHA